MFSQDDDALQGVVLTVVFCLVAMVIALVIVLGMDRISQRIRQGGEAAVSLQNAAALTAHTARTADTAPTISTPAASGAAALPLQDADSAAQAASDAASVKVEYGVVKFYFASGKADLPPGAVDALAGVVKGASVDRKLVVSGFHDATGNAIQNAELAMQRALAVRNALKAAGVSEGQIDIKKPVQMAQTLDHAEARRVEVALQ